jgi:NADH pyrophosphatase NudC (nudix superfamily)
MTDQLSSSNTPAGLTGANTTAPTGSPLKDGEIDGRARQSCAANCGYVFWDNPTPVVAGIVELDGQVVLVRSKGWPGRFFGTLSGFLESGEKPEDAVLRELKEELGLEET